MTGPTEGTCVEQPHAHVGQCYRRGLADGYAQGLAVTAETGPVAAAEAVLGEVLRQEFGSFLAHDPLYPDRFWGSTSRAVAAALAAAGLLADPAATDTSAAQASDEELDALVLLVRNAARGGCGAHEGCRALVAKKQRDAAGRWLIDRAVRDTTEPERCRACAEGVPAEIAPCLCPAALRRQ